jgi:type I restriction enzyme, S subunit
MNEWTETKVKELAKKGPASFIDGDWIEAPYITTEGIRLIQTGNIGIGHFVDHNKKFISDDSFVALRCKEVFPGDVLICRLADPIGRACIVPNLGVRNITSVDVCILRVDEDRFDKSFVVQRINEDDFLERCKEVSGGTTRQRISRTNLGNLLLPIPPLPQQRKIAKILTTVDNLIEKTEALIAKYQAIKQGMMHDLFTRGVDEHGHLRPTYDEAPELYKESELGWIPKEWEVRSLGEIAVVAGGVTLGRDLAGSQVVELPYLRVANVQDGYLDLSEIKTVSVLKCEVDRFMLEHGDMLMTEGGDFDKLGRGTVWRGQISPCLHQNHIFRVRPLKDFILPDFLAAVTASSYGKRYFLVSSKQTTNLATINSTQLKAFPVPLPNLDEQGRMIAAIASVERQIEAEQCLSNQMKQTKTGLMQDLLTGKVRVKVDGEAEDV